MISAVDRFVVAVTRAIAAVGLIALLVLAVLTIADGLMRSLANKPIEGVRDLASLIIAFAIACCLPVTLAERANVAVRVIDKCGETIAWVLQVAANAAALGVLVLMARQFFLHATSIARDGEVTWVLRVPTAPFWYSVDAILWCAALVQAMILILDCSRHRSPAKNF